MKTEGIDFDSSFIWLDDYPFQAELSVLRNFGAEKSIYRVNLSNKDELLNVMAFLKGIKEKKRKRLIMVLTIILSFLLSLGVVFCLNVDSSSNQYFNDLSGDQT